MTPPTPAPAPGAPPAPLCVRVDRLAVTNVMVRLVMGRLVAEMVQWPRPTFGLRLAYPRLFVRSYAAIASVQLAHSHQFHPDPSRREFGGYPALDG